MEEEKVDYNCQCSTVLVVPLSAFNTLHQFSTLSVICPTEDDRCIFFLFMILYLVSHIFSSGCGNQRSFFPQSQILNPVGLCSGCASTFTLSEPPTILICPYFYGKTQCTTDRKCRIRICNTPASPILINVVYYRNMQYGKAQRRRKLLALQYG